MVNKLVPPTLPPLEEPPGMPPAGKRRPELRTPGRRERPNVESLVSPGFVAEAPLSERSDPDDALETITIPIPRRVKRALLADVAARRDDPDQRSVA